MIRLCINCDTENPVDAVMCWECGMSVTQAPTVQRDRR
jgi:ribosomal protein L40E